MDFLTFKEVSITQQPPEKGGWMSGSLLRGSVSVCYLILSSERIHRKLPRTFLSLDSSTPTKCARGTQS